MSVLLRQPHGFEAFARLVVAVDRTDLPAPECPHLPESQDRVARVSRCGAECQNSRTVLPSVIDGGSTVPEMFSWTQPAARLDDSSVPVLSSQIVTVIPPFPLRNAAYLTKPGTPLMSSFTSSSRWPREIEELGRTLPGVTANDYIHETSFHVAAGLREFLASTLSDVSAVPSLRAEAEACALNLRRRPERLAPTDPRLREHPCGSGTAPLPTGVPSRTVQAWANRWSMCRPLPRPVP